MHRLGEGELGAHALGQALGVVEVDQLGRGSRRSRGGSARSPHHAMTRSAVDSGGPMIDSDSVAVTGHADAGAADETAITTMTTTTAN